MPSRAAASQHPGVEPHSTATSSTSLPCRGAGANRDVRYAPPTNVSNASVWTLHFHLSVAIV